MIMPVLAYATLPDGEGAFLIYSNEDKYPSGPTWITRHTPDTFYTDSEVRIELSVGMPPIKGEPCEITKGCVYDPDPCSMGGCCFYWII